MWRNPLSPVKFPQRPPQDVTIPVSDKSPKIAASWLSHELAPIFLKYTSKLEASQHTSHRRRPALWDLCQGDILWLPPKRTIDKIVMDKIALQGAGILKTLHRDAFDHPVLVLDVDVRGPEDAVVQFAIMRSKNKYSKDWMRILQKGARGASSNRSDPPLFESRYIPLTDHPNSGSGSLMVRSTEESNYLYLERDKMYRSSSWVDVHKTFSVEWQALQCYAIRGKPDGYRYRLTEDSFAKVVAKMRGQGILEESIGNDKDWINTNELWERFKEDVIDVYEERMGK